MFPGTIYDMKWMLQFGYQMYKASYLGNEILEDVEPNEDHIEHSREFSKPEVVQVSLMMHKHPCSS